MVDWGRAFLLSGAGYGINILVLIIISLIIWSISLITKTNEKSGKR